VLMGWRELANGMKHCERKPTRPSENELVRYTIGPTAAQTMRIVPLVRMADGSDQEAIPLARDAMAEWSRLFCAEGLSLDPKLLHAWVP
jgi:hypothetical protein